MKKIIDETFIKKKIDVLKNKNKKIGLCHGVFDLLHIGHINHISEAKNNRFKLYPSPMDISLEIKKYGLLKPFIFKKYKKFYSLTSGQARYWGLLMGNRKIKSVKGLLID